MQGWVKGLEFPVIFHRQVFTNKDDSTGTLYLISNDLSARTVRTQSNPIFMSLYATARLEILSAQHQIFKLSDSRCNNQNPPPPKPDPEGSSTAKAALTATAAS